MRVSYHRLYSWLSLSRILQISNFVLSRTILPVPWLFFSWSKQKTSGISNFYVSRINFAVSWAISSCYAKSCKFSSQISLFSTSASTMTTIVPARMCKDYQISKKSPLPKICHTYPTMMKLGTVIPYLKKIQKLYQSRDTPPEFCWHQHLFTGNQ